MSRRRPAEERPGAELTTTYNNLVTLEGRQKEYCGGCGLPRDPDYAKSHPCGACGQLGTQAKSPIFDDDGEPIAPVVKPPKVAEAKEPKVKQPTKKQQLAVARVATAALFRSAL